MKDKIEGYTPGPWHLKDKVVLANIHHGTVSIETPIADVCSTGIECWRLEEDANAQLIALTPTLYEQHFKMLEALKFALSVEKERGHTEGAVYLLCEQTIKDCEL